MDYPPFPLDSAYQEVAKKTCDVATSPGPRHYVFFPPSNCDNEAIELPQTGEELCMLAQNSPQSGVSVLIFEFKHLGMLVIGGR
jgi:hypothetical protein